MSEVDWAIEALGFWVLLNMFLSAAVDWREPTGPNWRALVFMPWYIIWRRRQIAERAEQRKELAALSLLTVRPRCPFCGTPHDLDGWPADICRAARRREL